MSKSRSMGLIRSRLLGSFKSSLRADTCPSRILLEFWFDVPSLKGVIGSGHAILGHLGRLNNGKPVEKTTHVSLVSDFTPGPSSGVRVCFLSCPSSPFFLLLFGYPPFESFAMSLEESDDLNIPDAAPVDPVLEACALLKFDMRPYKFSLNESHVKYLVKLYGIPEDLHPQVVPEGMTMNALPPGVIGLYAYYFQQGGLWLVPLGVNRVIFFETYCRSLDITPTVPLFRVFYKLCKQGKWFSFQNRAGKDWIPIYLALLIYNASEHVQAGERFGGEVITMDEFLCLPNFKGCKVFAGTLLPPGTSRVTHLAPHAGRLEDIPPKTGDMMVAELPCRKVLDDKEKKKRKAGEKASTKILAVNIQAETVVNKDAGREGPRKKRRVRVGPQVRPDSEHVSSPTPLNHAKPLEALANEEHVSPSLSVGRMDTLRDQTDEHATPLVLFMLAIRLLTRGSGKCRSLDTVEEPAPENIMPDAEASYSAVHVCNLPFNNSIGWLTIQAAWITARVP
ncbi:hypothetical protein Tco_0880740 [Tanacetum coccineum]